MPFLFVAAFATIISWIVISYFHGQTRKLKHIPSVSSDIPPFSYFGTFRFLRNSTDTINKGVKKWPDHMFKVPDLFQWIVVATGPKHIEELYKAPDHVFSSFDALAEIFQPSYTLGPNIPENEYHVPIVRSQLTQALPLLVPEVHDEIAAACNEFIPITEEWQSVRIMDTTMTVVSRASNRIFVGLPLCRNPDFVALNVQFTVDVIKTAFILRMVPDFLKPIVNSVISAVPKHIDHGLRHLVPLIHARRQEQGNEKPLDFLTWLMDKAKGEETTDRNLTLRILSVNFAAIHTSSMTFLHAFYYLATFPEYMQPLREEVEEIVKSEGWTKTGLDQMHKIDSFIKESQRLNPLSNLLMSRVAVNDFTFSDGTTIPRGTTIAVSSHNAQFSDKVYEDPLRFDGFRFSRMRLEDSGKKVGMITSSPDHLSFGHGRHICPGRHFAACEIKLIFAHIVMTYDVKLEIEGVRPPDMWIMAACVPNPNANVLFRKRTDAGVF
ncbi:cytochrome P450 [Phlegmacium glaucopus]|nr:cytochrome P450 [Phlegmacium glaucopus]